MLINIAKFAPYKYAELIFNEDTGDIEDYEWYSIELPNSTMKTNDNGELTQIDETP
jgi:hypothetical protein